MGGSFIEVECQRSKITPNLQRDYIIMRSGRFRGGIKFSVPPDGRSRPFEEIGCLYHSASKRAFVDPREVTDAVPHYGRPGGVLPRITDS